MIRRRKSFIVLVAVGRIQGARCQNLGHALHANIILVEARVQARRLELVALRAASGVARHAYDHTRVPREPERARGRHPGHLGHLVVHHDERVAVLPAQHHRHSRLAVPRDIVRSAQALEGARGHCALQDAVVLHVQAAEASREAQLGAAVVHMHARGHIFARAHSSSGCRRRGHHLKVARAGQSAHALTHAVERSRLRARCRVPAFG
mmetsp:Transcript_24077/g.62040  ORF Transcript_24077/g.62040 Transcript_24077/m.62040 type:complete len:208 (+) Transcript_24077:139-762(+)